MRIVFVGNFRPTFSTENDLAWTLRDMGHDVITQQEDLAYTDDILTQSQNADMFLYVHTHGWVTPGSLPMEEVIRRLKNRGVPTVAFHLDYWFGLERQVDVGKDAFWKCQFVFTADGDPRTQEWMRSLGINHYWSAPAVVKRDCYLATPNLVRRNDELQKQYDIIFVGSRNYHKEWPYREQLIHWLEVTYGKRFTLFGNQGVRSVRGPELNQLYADSKVVVGDSLCLGFDHKNYWSDRVYETRGRGGFLIHPNIEGLDDWMEKYNFGDFAALEQLINAWLENDEQREHKRIAAAEFVRDHHTYHNRMEAIFKTIGVVK